MTKHCNFSMLQMQNTATNNPKHIAITYTYSVHPLNTPQHAATHHNTPQHTATHCVEAEQRSWGEKKHITSMYNYNINTLHHYNTPQHTIHNTLSAPTYAVCTRHKTLERTVTNCTTRCNTLYATTTGVASKLSSDPHIHTRTCAHTHTHAHTHKHTHTHKQII